MWVRRSQFRWKLFDNPSGIILSWGHRYLCPYSFYILLHDTAFSKKHMRAFLLFWKFVQFPANSRGKLWHLWEIRKKERILKCSPCPKHQPRIAKELSCYSCEHPWITTTEQVVPIMIHTEPEAFIFSLNGETKFLEQRLWFTRPI